VELSLADIPREEIVTAGTGRDPDEGLRESMALYGLLEPLDVRARREGAYELVCGSRRLIAARGLGWGAITAVVEPAESATLPAELKALLTNLHRESLKQIHLAEQAKRVMARLECSQAERARRLRIGRSTLSQMLAVARCADLVPAVKQEGLEFGAARALAVLLPLERKALLAELRETARRDGRFPSVRRVELRVRERRGYAPLPRYAAEDLGELAAELAARGIAIEVQTLPGKRSSLQVILRLDEEDAAALREQRAAAACSHVGTTEDRTPAETVRSAAMQQPAGATPRSVVSAPAASGGATQRPTGGPRSIRLRARTTARQSLTSLARRRNR
jgi:ParB family chromosome partitioning protein